MARKRSPLALKRGPKKLHTSVLLKRIEALKRRKKRKMVLPTIKLWPGQVAAGIVALNDLLWTDPATGVRSLVYEVDKEKIVRAVYRACVEARNARARMLKRRAGKREVTNAQKKNAQGVGESQ